MATVIGTIVSFLVVFSILVFVHEFGHFFTAKLCGVRVEVFSLGYGKRLFGVKKGTTDYRISMFPIGGYVRLLGEGMFEKERPLAPDDLMAKPRWQRLLIMAMGSIMNIVLAIVLVSIIDMVGVSVPKYQSQPPVIGWIDADSPAEKAGLTAGDEILTINQSKVRTWSDVEIAVGSKPDKTIAIGIKRNGEERTVNLRTESLTEYAMGYAGMKADIRTQIQMVAAGSPAEKAGLTAGDVILSMDGKPVNYFNFVDSVEKAAGRTVPMTVERKGAAVDLTITPRREGKVGKIGTSLTLESVKKKYAFLPAIGASVRENTRNTTIVLKFLKDLFSGQASTKQLGGPLEIANFSYAAARLGLMTLLGWLAVISLQLGILNLFPIPVMDGGQIFILLIEGLTRRDLSPKAREIWMNIGFVIFAFLIVFVILNDIVKKLPNGWQSLLPF